jgi:hypothetical protein
MKYYAFAVSVVFLLGIVVSLSGQNLLQNPGFENWLDDSTCENWYTETTGIGAARESGIIHSGTYSAKLILTSTETQRFTQYVSPITVGNDYQFSFWCYDNDQYGRARVVIRWYDGSGNLISGYYGDYSADSTEWQELITGPQGAPASAETAHVEVRLYDVSGFTDTAIVYVDDASFVDLGSGTPPDTLTIYEIQGQVSSSPYEDSTVVTYGVVTGVYGSDLFIEEQPGGGWHGIYVFGSSTTPVRGDSVRVTGLVSEYYGMTELTGPIVDILASGSVVPGPTVLPTGSVPVEDYESVLMRVEDATCTNDSLGYGEWEVDDGSGPLIIDDMGVVYVPDSGQIYTVTGPIMYSYGNFMMEPRDSNDIVEGGGGVTEIRYDDENFAFSLNPSVSTGSVNIDLSIHSSTETEISIYSISGQKIGTVLNKSLKKGRHTLTWNRQSIPNGIYFIRVQTENRSETKKVSIIR